MEDSFEYWKKLNKKGQNNNNIHYSFQETVKGVHRKSHEEMFRCTDYNVFSFDNRVISVTIANYNDSCSFTISLEDLQFF